MSFKKTLCGLLTIAAIGAGCCNNTGSREHLNKIPEDITLSGKPISVNYTPNSYGYNSAFVGVFEIDGKSLLTYNSLSRGIQAQKAAVIVESERNDGDDELVKLTGHYNGNEFELSSVEANGYKVDFWF